ncbi:hypothetical protein EVAR_21588_1 [Eumeta japonica]|uniref:Uncharacterized protein n=1 Tax=Eumeta variegata TaxID=151549 RepID=A0A4C1UY32_EUMVA|nr:hypothetical protein EVAR_21588_1 [Eumeta japonica]
MRVGPGSIVGLESKSRMGSESVAGLKPKSKMRLAGIGSKIGLRIEHGITIRIMSENVITRYTKRRKEFIQNVITHEPDHYSVLDTDPDPAADTN